MPVRDLLLRRWHTADDPGRDPDAALTSPVVDAGFPVASLLPSWSARTPPGTWVDVEVRADADAPWTHLARWSETGPRTTFGRDAHGPVRRHDDELLLDGTATTGQARLVPGHRSDGPRPRLGSLTLLLSGPPVDPGEPTPPSGPAHAVEVPPYSQQLHRDLTDAVAGGGRNWCSPTATLMVLDRWGAGPPTPPGAATRDAVVPLAAEAVHDTGYGGTGNWAFNTAWAATHGVDAFVTRLRDLADLEALTRADVPVVVSAAFTAEELDGAGFGTEGHLMVVRGFDEHGDVLVHDPASQRQRSDDAVARTYRRDQLHASWLHRSSGVAYVVRPPELPLPALDDVLGTPERGAVRRR